MCFVSNKLYFVTMVVGFTFASKISGWICPWTVSRGIANQCVERCNSSSKNFHPLSLVDSLFILYSVWSLDKSIQRTRFQSMNLCQWIAFYNIIYGLVFSRDAFLSSCLLYFFLWFMLLLKISLMTLSVSIGDVVLKDLKLKAEALNSLKLPVTVKAGFVGTITLKVVLYI